MSLAVLLATVGAALVTTAVTTAVFVRLAPRCGLVDVPNARSSHSRPVPRGGGLPLLAGAALGLLAAGTMGELRPDGSAIAAGTGLGVVALVGLLDDRRGLSPVVRLAAQAAAAAGVVVVAGGLGRLPLPPPLDAPLGDWGIPLALLWIVAVVNFYNFMDGVDGIAGLQGAVTGMGLALAGWSPFTAGLGAALAGACLGFLFHNWSPARVFLGDVGSGTLGFAFATAPFLAPEPIRPTAVLFVAASLWLFLADASATLASRAWRGARWHVAHREHAYQRLVIAGWSHARVAALVGTGSALLTALALAAWNRRLPWGAVIAGALFVSAAEAVLARAAARRVAA
jgi:Fuc2NAc and GlcNAc transferase